MRQKPTLGMGTGRLLVAAFGVLLAILFTTGVFGGSSTDIAEAQTPTAVIPCDLPPFSDGDGDAGTDITPSCSLDPLPVNVPNECTDDTDDTLLEDQPYEIELGDSDEPSFHCYNLAFLECAFTGSADVSVVGTIVDPPFSAITGFIIEDGNGASENLIDAAAATAYDGRTVQLFHASLGSVPIGAVVTVDIEGATAGTFTVNPTESCDSDTDDPMVVVTADCSDSGSGLTATPDRDVDADEGYQFFGFQAQVEASSSAPFASPSTTLDFDYASGFAPPGTFRWSLSPPDAPLIQQGTIHCIELLPEFVCVDGQVAMQTFTGDTVDDAIAAIREIATLTVTADGVEATAPDFTFLFAEPPVALPTLAFTVEPNSPGSTDTTEVQIYYTSDITVDIPATCLVDLDYVCSAGQGEIVADTSGTPDDTVVRKTNPSPVAPAGSDGNDPAGTLLTFTIGSNNDDGDQYPGTPSDNGVRFSNNGQQTIQRNKLACTVEFDVSCQSGRAVAEFGDFVGSPASIPPGFAGFELTGQSGLVQPDDGYELDGGLADVTAFDPTGAVHLVPPNSDPPPPLSVTLPVPDCIVDVSVACVDGMARLTADAGGTGAAGLVIEGTNYPFDNEGMIDFVLPEPYPGDLFPVVRVDARYDGNPDGLSINDPDGPEIGFAWVEGDGGTEYHRADFDVPRCVVEVDAVCGAGEGGPTGQAVFRTDRTGTPAATRVLGDRGTPNNGEDDFVLADGAILEAAPIDLAPGEQFDAFATNGVWVTAGSQPVPFVSLTVPSCTVYLDVATRCIDGQPAAAVQATYGGYTTLTNTDPPYASSEIAFDRTFFFADPAEPITVTIYLYYDDAIVIATVDGESVPFGNDDGETDVTAPTCVVDPTIECAAGAAFMQVDTSAVPDGVMTTPANGEEVAQGTSIAVSATDGVYVRHVPTEQFDQTISLVAPICVIDAELVCQTGEGGPTGLAVLQTDIPALTPAGTIVTPPPGTTTASEGSLTVSVNNGVHVASTGTASAILDAPACVVTATSVARCAGSGIEVEVTTAGAEAAAVVIDGTSYPTTGTTTTVTGFEVQAAYEIEIVPADPLTVATGATETISIAEADRCTIELQATLTCISGQVLIIVVPTAESTGTVQTVAVNGDSNLPFFVAPGTDATITATSSDTLPGDITIPMLSIPTRCDNSLIPLAGTLYVDYDAVCSADAQRVIVEVATTGSAGVLAMSVNSDPAAPFLITPGDPIVLSVLTFIGNDVIIINGPAQAPVCLGATPTPDPTPVPVPTLPPAIVVLIPTNDPTPPADTAPEPTPESTPAATPDPTPEPTVAPTPAPTPEPSPDPTPEPTPDIPDEVLSGQASLRQHGQSSVLLPAACDVEEISLPGAVRLVRDGVADDGRIRFIADTAALDVGTYREIISCAGQQVDVELFIYRQIGGARGEANSISRLAITGGVLTLVLIGVPGIIARKDEDL